MSATRWRPLAMILGAVIVTLIASKRLVSSLERLDRAHAMLCDSRLDADKILDARRTTRWLHADLPLQTDLTPRVITLMERAGIEPQRLRSVRQIRDDHVPAQSTQRLRRRTVSVTMDTVTIAQIVSYLDLWELEAPEWTIARVEVQRHTSGPGLGGLRLDVVRTYAEQ